MRPAGSGGPSPLSNWAFAISRSLALCCESEAEPAPSSQRTIRYTRIRLEQYLRTAVSCSSHAPRAAGSSFAAPLLAAGLLAADGLVALRCAPLCAGRGGRVTWRGRCNTGARRGGRSTRGRRSPRRSVAPAPSAASASGSLPHILVMKMLLSFSIRFRSCCWSVWYCKHCGGAGSGSGGWRRCAQPRSQAHERRRSHHAVIGDLEQDLAVGVPVLERVARLRARAACEVSEPRRRRVWHRCQRTWAG